jgi:protein TonB
VYPPELLRAGIEGTVTFRLSIAADGTVAAATIERSSGFAALDRAAEQAVRRWRFTPARRLGVAVPIEVRKSFPFVIERRP